MGTEFTPLDGWTVAGNALVCVADGHKCAAWLLYSHGTPRWHWGLWRLVGAAESLVANGPTPSLSEAVDAAVAARAAALEARDG